MELSVGVIKRLSDDVINRIAAGEVIQRPVNAVKELMENCIDAGASSIQIIIKNGGLKSIQIQDNGTGIRKEDLDIVCERFTTSKLQSIDDLYNMQTHGFRGEALSSISHVSHLTITTKIENDVCGYKVSFVDGKPKSSPQPIAANRGTTILVEDLFYNLPVRRNAMKSPYEEYNIITDVVTKYALHNCNKTAFILKKFGESNSEVNTLIGMKIIDAIKLLYGVNVSRDLIEISLKDDNILKFSLKGFISNSNVSLKKFNFILFINDRLVDCDFLKKAIDIVYCKNLAKGSHPFVYLSLNIALKHIDINVHPTKSEVHFLREDEICAKITQLIEQKISESDLSKNFVTQKLLMNTSFAAKYDAIAANDGKNNINKSFSSVIKIPAKKRSAVNRSESIKEQSKTIPVTIQSPQNQSKPNPVSYIRTDSTERKINEFFGTKSSNTNSSNTNPSNTNHIRREIKLSSVLSLRETIGKICDKNLQDLICKSTYVGCANERFVLIQHETQLMIVNIENINRELFYQLFLIDFGNFGIIKLSSPLKITQLVMMYLNCVKTEETKNVNPEEIESILLSKSAMLSDYFSLNINDNGEILTLPMVLDGHTPNMAFFPQFICSLAHDVNWKSEKECFESVGRVLAQFYAKTPNKFQSDDDHTKWAKIMELVLYPAYKAVLCPSKNLANELTFCVAANLSDLYKVFERC